MTATTKTVTLDFGVPAVAATVTFEDELPQGPTGCPMCSEVTASEPAFLTMCARCQDSAADCATCAPPAADWLAVVNDDVPAREAGEGGWWWESMDDAAARMWDFK